jgi:broad specificity phosphatase PhoE
VLEIVFETHSTSVDNEAGIATGWLPGRLSETGKRQAEELGARRRDNGLTAVFTSDLARAVETAEIAFAGSALPIHSDARLRECDYGELNGMPVAELDAVRLRHVDEPFPGGESYRGAVARVGGFLDNLTATRDGERVLLIGHAATRWALDHLVNGVPLEQLVAAPFDWQEGWVYRLTARNTTLERT